MSDHAQPQPAQRAEKPIRRFGWVRWVIIVQVVAVVGLLGVRTLWRRAALGRLEAQLARVRHDGHPLDLRAAGPTTAPADNAAPVYRRAWSAVSLTPRQEDLIRSMPAPPTMAEAESIASANRSALDLLHQARSRRGVDWALPSGWSVWPRAELSAARRLTMIAGWRSAVLTRQGRWGEAASVLRDVHAMARAIEPEFFIGVLVASKLDALAAESGRFLAWELSQSGAELDSSARRTLRGLIDDLSAEGNRDALAAVMAKDRAMVDGEILGDWQGLAAASGIPHANLLRTWPIRFFAEPWMIDDRRYALAHMTDLVRMAQAPNYHRCLARAPDGPPEGLDRHIRPASLCLGTLERGFVLWYRFLIGRKLTGAALAAAMYRCDHGDWPATLSSLTPEYITAVGADPHSPTGATIQAVLTPPAPRVYGVYEDGQDDGGADARTPAGRLEYESTPDYTVLLAPPSGHPGWFRFSPTPATAPQRPTTNASQP